jgi:hypothetical protein
LDSREGKLDKQYENERTVSVIGDRKRKQNKDGEENKRKNNSGRATRSAGFPRGLKLIVFICHLY